MRFRLLLVGLVAAATLAPAPGATALGVSDGNPSCEAPLEARALLEGQFAMDELLADESDYWAFENDDSVFAFKLVAIGGSVTVWAYEDCAFAGCGFFAHDLPATVGGGACWGDDFDPDVIEVRAQSAPLGQPIRYALYMDDCPPLTINTSCLVVPDAA
jgi:hypothetical protein